MKRVGDRRLRFGLAKEFGDARQFLQHVFAIDHRADRAAHHRAATCHGDLHARCVGIRCCLASFAVLDINRRAIFRNHAQQGVEQVTHRAGRWAVAAGLGVEDLSHCHPLAMRRAQQAPQGGEMPLPGRARLAFDGVQRQHAGGQFLFGPRGIHRAHQLGLLILPIGQRRAIWTLKQCQLAQRLRQRAIAALAVQPGHRTHASGDTVLVGHGIQVGIPIRRGQAGNQMCAGGNASRPLAAHHRLGQPGGHLQVLAEGGQSLHRQVAHHAPLRWRREIHARVGIGLALGRACLRAGIAQPVINRLRREILAQVDTGRGIAADWRQQRRHVDRLGPIGHRPLPCMPAGPMPARLVTHDCYIGAKYLPTQPARALDFQPAPHLSSGRPTWTSHVPGQT